MTSFFKNDHEAAMALVGIANMNGMDNRPDLLLLDAAGRGNTIYCTAAIFMGADNFQEMLEAAARHGHVEVCKMALAHGAKNVNRMLAAATRGNSAAVARLSKDSGAKNFVEMREIALLKGFDGLFQLAKQWINEA